jgi:hypothetical protein
MTEKANPSVNRAAEAFKTAGAIAYGGSDEGFISPANQPTEISVQDSDINESSLNAFDETSSASSLDVTLDGGEAFVFGSWLAIDTQTTVSLAASTSGQTVFVGWNKDGADDIIIGLQSSFSSAGGDADQKIPLFTFDTDGSGVTSVTDERSFDQISAESVEQGPGSGLDADTIDGVEANQLGGGSIANDGSVVTASTDEIDFTTNITATDDGDGTSTVAIDDGSGSGLDADTVDGLEASEIEFTDEKAQDAIGAILGANLNYDDSNNTIIIVQGSGSGLDADTVDSIEVTSLIRSDADDSFSGEITGNAILDLNTSDGRFVLPVGSDKYAT